MKPSRSRKAFHPITRRLDCASDGNAPSAAAISTRDTLSGNSPLPVPARLGELRGGGGLVPLPCVACASAALSRSSQVTTCLSSGGAWEPALSAGALSRVLGQIARRRRRCSGHQSPSDRRPDEDRRGQAGRDLGGIVPAVETVETSREAPPGGVRVPDGPGSVRRGLGPCRCPHAWVALPSTPRMVRRSPVESGPDHFPGPLCGGRALSWESRSIPASADPAGTRPRGWASAPALAASA
jgi:hypothetical protein